MNHFDQRLDRRKLLAALTATFALGLAGPVRAAGLGAGLSDLLGRASDSSLDKLGTPGAFYADPAVRIGLPLVGRGLGGGLGGTVLGLLDKGQQLGLTDNLIRKLNDAAGSAAHEAKPIFRTAISRLTLADVPDIATRHDGATQYLRTSAGGELSGKLRPLVDRGLTSVGALREIDRLVAKTPLLRSAGLSRDFVGRSVTEQALNGIFSYIGAEEGRLRDNPVGAAGGLLKGLLGN
jgi:hypothetical protein